MVTVAAGVVAVAGGQDWETLVIGRLTGSGNELGGVPVVLGRDHADARGKGPDDLAELPIDARHRRKHARLRARASV